MPFLARVPPLPFGRAFGFYTGCRPSLAGGGRGQRRLAPTAVDHVARHGGLHLLGAGSSCRRTHPECPLYVGGCKLAMALALMVTPFPDGPGGRPL